jgi:hypothetical protein
MIGSHLLKAGAALSLAGPAGTAAAQPSTARHSVHEPPARAEIALQQVARCFVVMDRPAVASIVDPPLRADESFREVLLQRNGWKIGRCLARLNGGSLGARGPTMIGAFAGALYARRFHRLPVLGAVTLPAMTEPDPLNIQATRVFANCVIDRDAASVDAFVRSDVDSEEERGALSRLAPLFDGCRDAGHPIVLDRLTLRVYLSELLYRRARAGRRTGPAAQSQTGS